jgi:hypothetical protein
MKKNKIIFWVSTGVFSSMMLFSAFSYFANEEVKGAFVHLGFPDYFRVQLGVAKVLGVAALLIPVIPRGFKIFAYAGFAINLLSASIAHVASGDPMAVAVTPLIFLGILAVSFTYYLRFNEADKKESLSY